MFNLFAAFRRLTASINNLASTLDAANDRAKEVLGYETPAPVDITDSLPAPTPELENGNGEHSRKKVKAK